MFSTLGRIANKYKFIILAGWIILAAILFITAPSLSKVGVTDQSQFLPQNTESSSARDLLNTKFGNASQASSSSAIIVVFNEKGLSQQDMDSARSLHDWLISESAPEVISGVNSVFDSEALRPSLVSKDGTTMMMTVKTSVAALTDAAKQAVINIRAQIKKYPETTFYLTGNVGLLYDLFDSVQRSIDKTTMITVILVIVLLLIVFRSPIASLVPLAAIGSSFLVARGIVGFLAQAGVGVSTITDAYMVVTIFGVGTDYCLFIISRFREELSHGDQANTIEFTMRRIGPIIVASATTVIIAFLCLGISRFGMTRTSGWALAIGIAVTLAAGLTLVPALMAIFGRFLYWPSMAAPVHKQRKFGWFKIGQWVAAHPLVTAVPIIIVLALPYLSLRTLNLSANTLSQIPKNVESADGFSVIRDHFPAGELSPLYLMVQSQNSLLTPDSMKSIEDVAKSLNSVDGIARVDYFSAPSSQLIELGAEVHGYGDMLSGTGIPDITKLSSIQSISGELQSLAVRYPGVTQSAAFTRSITDLTQLSTMLGQLRSATPANLTKILPEAQKVLYDLSDALTSLDNEFELNGNSPFVKWLQATYFSADGTTARMNLILKTDPYLDASSQTVAQVREATTEAINATSLKGVSHYIGGDAAIHTDMLNTSNADFIRVLIITSIGILAVIIILLRSLLAPLYMVLTVLFNFGATLGITAWLFLDVLKGDNLIYLLPVFVFVMLAAVGADYNIFLVSRIREEAEQRSIKEAVQHAVANTGGVITSCGIILAGTFATLATSSLPMVLQIGAPIAIGVLIDTFLVRALLVPSLAALSGRWSWWPSKLFRRLKQG
jgi:putative drug exporter of the RND superfamily